MAEYASRAAAGERIEYSDGIIEPMPNNDSVHDVIKFRLATALARRLPEPALVGNEMAFDVASGYVRHPDVAVLLEPPPMVEHAKVQGAPDLAIEIVSESDTAEKLDERIELYLANGAKSVWVVWPHSRRVDVHQPGEIIRRYRGGILTGEEPVPGFHLDLDQLFQVAYSAAEK